jgi:CHASE3 domain sensor protein
MSELRQRTIDSPQRQAALNDLQPVIDARWDNVRTVSLAQQGRRQEALAIVSSGFCPDLMDQIQAKIDTFCGREQALLVQRQAKGATLRVWLLVLIFSSLAGAIGLAATFGQEAKRGINQLTSAVSPASKTV